MRASVCVAKKKHLSPREAEPCAQETGAQGRRRRRARKSQIETEERGRKTPECGTGSACSTQPQQTCLTLPAFGR